MPIYEFQCPECQAEIEVMQGLNDPSPLCPVDDTPMNKLMSQGAFQLKGTGWYATDYGPNSKYGRK